MEKKICKECHGEKIGRYKDLCNKCYSRIYMRTYVYPHENKLKFLRRKVKHWYGRLLEHEKMIEERKKEMKNIRRILSNPRDLIQY